MQGRTYLYCPRDLQTAGRSHSVSGWNPDIRRQSSSIDRPVIVRLPADLNATSLSFKAHVQWPRCRAMSLRSQRGPAPTMGKILKVTYHPLYSMYTFVTNK